MNRLLIKTLFILAFAVTMITACQEDDIALTRKDTPDIETALDTIGEEHSLSKKAFLRKYGEVYFMNMFDGDNHKYKTLKIRDISGTICQEWFYEDLYEKGFEPYSVMPGDEDGSQHGFFYNWEGTMSDVSQYDWNELIYADSQLTTPVLGFHIPNQSDLIYLWQIVGSPSSKMPSILNLKSHGYCYPKSGPCPPFWTPNVCSFWLDPIDSYFPENRDPSQHEGCGITADWYIDYQDRSPNLAIGHTNMPDLRCNVRLMRYITKEQW